MNDDGEIRVVQYPKVVLLIPYEQISNQTRELVEYFTRYNKAYTAFIPDQPYPQISNLNVFFLDIMQRLLESSDSKEVQSIILQELNKGFGYVEEVSDTKYVTLICRWNGVTLFRKPFDKHTTLDDCLISCFITLLPYLAHISLQDDVRLENEPTKIPELSHLELFDFCTHCICGRLTQTAWTKIMKSQEIINVQINEQQLDPNCFLEKAHVFKGSVLRQGCTTANRLNRNIKLKSSLRYALSKFLKEL